MSDATHGLKHGAELVAARVGLRPERSREPWGPLMPWDDSSAGPTWTALNAAIGSLIVSAAQLEDIIRAVLLNLIGGRDWRRIGLVIEGYTTSQIRERCVRLAHTVLGGDLQTDVLEWLKAAEQA